MGDLHLIFKGTVGFNLPNVCQRVLVCMLSVEPLAGMLPHLHAYVIGAGSIADLILVTLTLVSRSE